MQKQIQHYKILSQIGSGGMGSVYLGEDEMLDRKVAIKVLNPQLTADTQFRDRFRQEAKLQASLLHPNIVALHSFFEDQGSYCMVMEYAEGETLKQMIERMGPIPEERALKIFRQMLEAVGYAHSKGIIHRDIKPSNIIVDSHDMVKVMDFGIAKLLGDKGMTKTGAKMGTVYYMSPEQIKAAKDIDQRTDIYSLGITLYEMVSGQLPFDANTESEFEIMQEIVNRELPDPRKFYPHISDTMVNAINMATAKERNKRFSDLSVWIKRFGNMEENAGSKNDRGIKKGNTIEGDERDIQHSADKRKTASTQPLNHAASDTGGSKIIGNDKFIPQIDPKVSGTYNESDLNDSKNKNNRMVPAVILLIGFIIAAWWFFGQSGMKEKNGVPINAENNQSPSYPENLQTAPRENARAEAESRPDESSEVQVKNSLEISRYGAISVYEALSDDGILENYKVSNMTDGKISTWWTPSSHRDGIGALAVFSFLNLADVAGINIHNGSHYPNYPKYGDIFKLNNRVKKISFQFSSGKVISVELYDADKIQHISFPVQSTTYVRIIIDEIYQGSQWSDLCISEVQFLAR